MMGSARGAVVGVDMLGFRQVARKLEEQRRYT
jgi:hypothetical protein